MANQKAVQMEQQMQRALDNLKSQQAQMTKRTKQMYWKHQMLLGSKDANSDPFYRAVRQTLEDDFFKELISYTKDYIATDLPAFITAQPTLYDGFCALYHYLDRNLEIELGHVEVSTVSLRLALADVHKSLYGSDTPIPVPLTYPSDLQTSVQDLPGSSDNSVSTTITDTFSRFDYKATKIINGRYHCNEIGCDVSYSCRTSIRNHYKLKHSAEGAQKFCCKLCSYSFACKSALEKHKMSYKHSSKIAKVLRKGKASKITCTTTENAVGEAEIGEPSVVNQSLLAINLVTSMDEHGGNSSEAIMNYLIPSPSSSIPDFSSGSIQ